jgi:phage major head subunit gpT-like protein
MGASGLSSRAIIGKFFAALEQLTGVSWLDAISMYFKSDQESETYKWLGQSPAMREWVGGRVAKGFRENGLTIINKKYESTLEVQVDDMRRDKTGQLDIRINEQATRALSHWIKLLSTLIANGTGSTSGLCYDGQYFFDNDHSEGDSGTQTNLLTASDVAALAVTDATAPTAIEVAKAVLGIIAHMLTIKDDVGEPMNELAKNFLVMTSPVVWQHIAGGIYSPSVGFGETNPIINITSKEGFNVQLAANARLTYTTQLVVFRTDAPAKSLIRQEEEGITMKVLGEGSDYEFDNDAHKYGIKAIRNVGYGYWQYAAHATLSNS